MYDSLSWSAVSDNAGEWLSDAQPILVLLFGIVLAVSLLGLGFALVFGGKGDSGSGSSGAPIVDKRIK